MQIIVFLSFPSHLVEFQVCAYLSLDIEETFWAVRPNQFEEFAQVILLHQMKKALDNVSDSQLESACIRTALQSPF